MNRIVHLGFAVLTSVLLLQTGCSVLKPKPDLTQFYVLRARVDDNQAAAARGTTAASIRVGPGSLAAYLDNTSITVQDGNNRIQYLDLYRWAEPLSKGISRTLGENLAHLLSISHVTLYPDPIPGVAGYEVQYTILRFEGTLDSGVILDVWWQVFQQPEGRVIASERSVYGVPPGQLDVAAYVDRLSQALSAWATDVAGRIPSQ